MKSESGPPHDFHGQPASDKTVELANNFFLKDRCALPDQMSFVLTFPWRGFVFGIRNRDRTNLDEVAFFAFSVTTQDFPHEILL